ncbi:MAG: hypothetical protein ABFE16_16500 [Armatimonadia bacterium]
MSSRNRIHFKVGSLLLVTLLPTLAAIGQPATSATVARPSLAMYPPSQDHARGFRELFDQPEAWSKTRQILDSIGFADHVLNREFRDDELRSMFGRLREWGLKLELEVGAVKEWGPTGEKAFNAQVPMWDRFQGLGATIHTLALDEPLCCALNSLKKPEEYAVQETATFISLVRRRYPQTLIGDIEPCPSIPVADQIRWLEALQARLADMGVHGLDFFRLDVDWVHFVRGHGSWVEIRSLEQYCRSHQLPFSLLYWAADYPALNRLGIADEATWYISVMRQGYDYAMVGGAPDQYVIESWIPAPPRTVPETGEFTFTRSVLDFARRFLRRDS